MTTIVNDFTLNIATANGTGSQSANLILLQSLFNMGIEVSGKNLFPSNISGLPTWYIVRVSDAGYQAPGDRTHIQVLMNPDTWAEDLADLQPGSVVIWNTDAKMVMDRVDVVSYPVPMTTMARTLNPKLARMVANVIYVGVIAEMLGIEDDAILAAIAGQFKGKASAIDLNTQAYRLGRTFANEELTKADPYAVEARGNPGGRFFIEGNEAANHSLLKPR
jgi:2-oxoglutarate ferredoxin oxidoreductase subunit alpha